MEGRLLIRQLEYLVALAREGHFARAAAACRVTQPALSAGIRRLEDELGVAIVRRGNRFEGFTPEGERILAHAHRMVRESEALLSQSAVLAEGLTGILRLSAVPIAQGELAGLAAAFTRRHPRVGLRTAEHGPAEIPGVLERGEADAAVTHVDDGRPTGVEPVAPLYRERYVLLAPRDGRFAGCAQVRWVDLTGVPLCLRGPGAPERTAVEAAVRRSGADLAVGMESESVSGLYVYAQRAGAAAVLARSWLSLFPPPQDMLALPLVEPEVTTRMGLVVASHAARSPLVEQLLAVAREQHGAVPAARGDNGADRGWPPGVPEQGGTGRPGTLTTAPHVGHLP